MCIDIKYSNCLVINYNNVLFYLVRERAMTKRSTFASSVPPSQRIKKVMKAQLQDFPICNDPKEDLKE